MDMHIKKTIPGNAKSFTENALALWVTIIGEEFHFFHTIVMKYTERTNTSRNMHMKNILKLFWK